MAYLWVLPTALKLLFSFQRPDLEFIITANEYFSFVSLFILAFGVVFETPLVIVLLAAFGVVHPNLFAKNRPIALVLGAIVAALLTPPDAVSMMLMLVPLMLLYEIGILAARLLWRGGARAAGDGAAPPAPACLVAGAPPQVEVRGHHRAPGVAGAGWRGARPGATAATVTQAPAGYPGCRQPAAGPAGGYGSGAQAGSPHGAFAHVPAGGFLDSGDVEAGRVPRHALRRRHADALRGHQGDR